MNYFKNIMKKSKYFQIMILLLLVQTCAAMLIPVETLVPILALKKSSDSNGFMVENQRTRTRHNYILQGDLDNDIDVPDNSISYSEPLDLKNSEELPALIVDYANMIRNDIILLDNSVETRTRKRGNVKLRRSVSIMLFILDLFYVDSKHIPPCPDGKRYRRL